MNIKKLNAWADDYNSKLLAGDARFHQWAYMVRRDGSVWMMAGAFIVIKDEEWLVIFGEHIKPHIEHMDDVKRYHTLETVECVEEG